MIGLIFLIVIGLWILFAIWLAIWLTRFVKERWRIVAGFLLVPLVILLPVMDEVIAYPQMQALCDNNGKTRLTINEKEAYGRTVYGYHTQSQDHLWPRSVLVTKHESGYKDVATKESILISNWVTAEHGFLKIPAGSSGNSMTLILRSCTATKDDLARHPGGLLKALKYLNWTVVPTP